LNAVTKTDVFPLPRVDDTLHGHVITNYIIFFSTLDLPAGFKWIEIPKKTAFNTYPGHYEFCVTPFGFCNGPATFQRLMETGIKELLHSLDDVILMDF